MKPEFLLQFPPNFSAVRACLKTNHSFCVSLSHALQKAAGAASQWQPLHGAAMGAINSTLRAVKDVERVKTANVQQVRGILSSMAACGGFILVLYLAFFVLGIVQWSEFELQCAESGEPPCTRAYIYVAVYVVFFLFMTVDFGIALTARYASGPRLLMVGVATNAISALFYAAGKGLHYEALLAGSTTVPTSLVVLGITMLVLVGSYKALCAAILRNLARRMEDGSGFSLAEGGLPMASLDAADAGRG